jgi:restriction endonuclease S subunit
LKQILITISPFAIFSFSVFSAQAEIEGKAAADGKVELLNGGKNWKFEYTETVGACETLSSTVSFCRRLNAHLQNCLHKHPINWPYLFATTCNTGSLSKRKSVYATV